MAVAFLYNTPLFAPRPEPTIMATGVARPSAQGQLTTRTATALVREVEKSLLINIHIKNTMSETPITAGTKTPATLSASLAMGAFERETFLTSSTIFARVVSRPTLVARTVT